MAKPVVESDLNNEKVEETRKLAEEVEMKD